VEGARGVKWRELCELGLKLPGVVEGTSYGTPALHVRRALLVRLKEDGETAVVRVDPMDRDVLLEADPAAFFLTDHYVGYPWILVRLARVPKGVLLELLDQAWRMVAPKRLIAGTESPASANGRPGASSIRRSDPTGAARRRRTKG